MTSNEIKNILIKLLKEDPEFRKEFRDAIGIKEIEWGVELSNIRRSLDEQIRVNTETKLLLEGVVRTVGQLAEAQKKTEERLTRLEDTVAGLAEAQKKTEERLTRLEDTVAGLAEAQKKTEERLTRLEDTVAGLAEAQKKTEEKLNELAEAQKKTEERLTRLEDTVAGLAEAQNKAEQQIAKLAEAIYGVQKDVNGIKKRMDSMGERWGEDYEEVMRLFFKELVEEEGIDLTYVNRLTYKDATGQFGAKGTIYEIDILAKNGKVYLIEVKSFAEGDDVDWFNIKTNVVSKVYGFENPIRLFLAVSAVDEAVERAKEYGIRMLAGYVIEKRRRPEKSQD
ncbi:hypothetical protein HS7_03320 [Sulfolobales archaeon HS-7]|nr:hypothetical protein HS7_03320 [Sulfolobales archaeon HS-7]